MLPCFDYHITDSTMMRDMQSIAAKKKKMSKVRGVDNLNRLYKLFNGQIGMKREGYLRGH